MSRIVTLIAVGALITACAPREAGPHESEYGETFFWEVVGSDVTFGDACTDAEEFRDDIQPIEFEENTFLIYKLSDDGSQAVAQDCTTTQAESCTDSDVDITFGVTGNQLEWEAEPAVNPIDGSLCDLEAQQVWTLTDRGETLDMEVALSFSLVGDVTACDELQSQAEADSPNGEGLDQCEVTMLIDTEFYRTDS
jgi:hypothetical protein